MRDELERMAVEMRAEMKAAMKAETRVESMVAYMGVVNESNRREWSKS